MIDTEQLKQTVDLRQLAARYTHLKAKGENAKEFAGSCPVCGGEDRFYVQSRFFACRHCHPKRGDAIAFIQWADGVNFKEACERLGGSTMTPTMRPTMTPTMRPTMTPTMTPKPSADWQTTAWKLVDEFEQTLWSVKGMKALSWLKARGLWEETLLGWRVGYCPADAEYHGLFVARGIVIPWLAGDEVWKLNVRRPVGKPKYQAVKGSRLSLFGIDKLTNKPDCLITEGEFDAMLVWQEVGHLTDVISLGSSNGTVADTWLPGLIAIRRFWIATDNDEEGDKAAAYWLTLTGERGQRIKPRNGKDITESWQAGENLSEWAVTFLNGQV